MAPAMVTDRPVVAPSLSLSPNRVPLDGELDVDSLADALDGDDNNGPAVLLSLLTKSRANIEWGPILVSSSTIDDDGGATILPFGIANSGNGAASGAATAVTAAGGAPVCIPTLATIPFEYPDDIDVPPTDATFDVIGRIAANDAVDGANPWDCDTTFDVDGPAAAPALGAIEDAVVGRDDGRLTDPFDDDMDATVVTAPVEFVGANGGNERAAGSAAHLSQSKMNHHYPHYSRCE
jgi:hypothetical protein